MTQWFLNSNKVKIVFKTYFGTFEKRGIVDRMSKLNYHIALSQKNTVNLLSLGLKLFDYSDDLT